MKYLKKQKSVGFDIKLICNCVIPLVVFFTWGFGQIFPDPSWYFHGVALPDFIAIAYFAFLIGVDSSFRRAVFIWLSDNRRLCWLVVALTLILLSSLLFSPAAQSEHFSYYLMSILRNGYFLLVALLVSVWAAEPRLRVVLLTTYLSGLLLVLSWYVVDSYSEASSQLWPRLCGRPIVDQRNVVGNLMAVGIVFSILLLDRLKWLSVAFVIAFLYGLLYTFSKGGWAMGLVATLGFASVLFCTRRGIAIAFLTLLLSFTFLNYNQFDCMVTHKLKSAQQSNLERSEFAKRAVSVASSNVLGKGVGNSISIHGHKNANATGFSSADNPHSAFLYVLENGGWFALVVYVMIFLYPFFLLLRAPQVQYKIIGISAGLAFGLSGIVQLQLYSQQFFWIFVGLVIAILKSSNSQSS